MENNNLSRDKFSNRPEKKEPEEVFTVPYDKFKEMFHVKHFVEILKGWGIELSDHQLQQFYEYYKDLVRWNTVMNLTAITELEDVLTKHFLDSVSVVKILPADFFNKSILMIDVGTGAGFPGIPLAIIFPQWKVVLMDSLNKRVQFLNSVTEKIGLKNVSAIHARAEELARDKNHREKYDLVCSRAVAELNCLLEYCLPFTKKQGYFIAYKSEKAEEEISRSEKALNVLGGKIDKSEKFELPSSEYGRTLILVEKEKNTPSKYPRKAGTPTKEPII